MKRLTVGAALGGLAVYLFDPDLGAARRDRLSSVWRENRGRAVQAGQAASDAAEVARPLARRLTTEIGRRDWAKAFDRDRSAVSLPKLIVAAALGGTLVYFLDPLHGSQRRHLVLHAGRRTVQQLATAVKPLPGRISGHFADSGKSVKSKVS
jgi:hypothetical protein